MRKVSKIKLSTDLDLINSIQNPHIVTRQFFVVSAVSCCVTTPIVSIQALPRSGSDPRRKTS